MAIKAASLARVFTPDEIAQMDPELVNRMKTAMEYAILKSGGRVVDPKGVEERFAALKVEALSIRPGALELDVIRPTTIRTTRRGDND